MVESFTGWMAQHWLELAGTIAGLGYVLCSIRQSMWVWPLSIISSLLYAAVFAQTAIYANMALQGYFVLMSFYGWYFWIKGKQDQSGMLPVKRINWRMGAISALFTGIVFLLLFLLLRQTDSPVPLADALTTALSMLATWMLARKFLENWLVWIIVDSVSAAMYAWQDLWLTAGLYILFTALAISGYWQWKKSLATIL